MELLNLALSFGGFVGWFYVWSRGQYKTGATLRTQVGVMLLGLMWLMLILADTYQNLQPTWGTISARITIAIAFVCLMPLLKSPAPKSKGDANGA